VASATNDLAAQQFRYLALFAVSSLNPASDTLYLPHLCYGVMSCTVCCMCSSSTTLYLIINSSSISDLFRQDQIH